MKTQVSLKDSRAGRRESPALVSVLALAMVAGACGGGQQSAAPSAQSSAGPGAQTSSATAQPAGQSTAAPAAKDLQTRVSDSLNRTIDRDKITLASYHLEVSGREPQWNPNTKNVETAAYTLRADVSGSDLHLIDSRTSPGKPAETTEGYVVKGGLSKQNQGGQEYDVIDGKLADSFLVSLRWAVLPLGVGIPLVVAATGVSAQGEETISGRASEKYGVDSRKAPAGVIGVVGGMIGITESKGTAWIDRQTGALLKLTLDYQQDLFDTSGGQRQTVGKGSGHIDFDVTKVGDVKVTLPTGAIAPAGGVQATAAPTGTTAPAIAGASAAPAEASVAVGKTYWHSGFKVTITTASVKTDTGGRALVLEAKFENLSNDTAQPRSRYEVVSKGKAYPARSSDDATPNVAGGSSASGRVAFNVDAGFALDDAVLRVGTGSENQAVVPLGRTGTFVSLEPKQLALSGSIEAGVLRLEFSGGVVRGDTADLYYPLSKGTWLIRLDYLAKNNAAAATFLDPSSFTLRRPDGTVYRSSDGSSPQIEPGATARDLLIAFNVKEPITGTYTLNFKGDYGANSESVEGEVGFEVR